MLLTPAVWHSVLQKMLTKYNSNVSLRKKSLRPLKLSVEMNIIFCMFTRVFTGRFDVSGK